MKDVKSRLGLYHFEDWFIDQLSTKEFQFGIDPFPSPGKNHKFFYLNSTIYSSYDSCFRAARKWMRDNQNIIYKEV